MSELEWVSVNGIEPWGAHDMDFYDTIPQADCMNLATCTVAQSLPQPDAFANGRNQPLNQDLR